MRFLVFVIVLSFLSPASALAAKRLGLIIGNDTYAHVPVLDKARGDAEAVSQTLEGLGFETITVLDANRREMNRQIATFTSRLEPGDTAMLFFAGHGVEIDGENYLLPIDIAAPDSSGEDFVKYESIALSDLLHRVQKTGARTTLMFLDACRDNPFAGTVGGRSIGGARGLARVSAPEGTFVVFSAGARQQALDRLTDEDPNRNSVFTRLLLPKMAQPGLELRQLVSELRLEVRNLARTRNHEQFPAYYDELLGEFFFAPKRGLKPSAGRSETDIRVATASPGDIPLTSVPADRIDADFRLAQSINNAEAYRAFLQQYEGNSDALLPLTLARQLLAGLEGETAKPAEKSTGTAEALPERSQDQSPPEPKPATEVATLVPENKSEPDDKERHLASRTDVIRATQRLLNARGCSAGGADGVIGPRTRRAFAAFIAGSGANLRAGALGTQHALDVIEANPGRICKTVAAVSPTAPAIATAPATGTSSPAAPSSGPSLAGNWSLGASCPLFIQSKGSVTYTRAGANSYRVAIVNNLGASGSGTAAVTGNRLSGRVKWSNGLSETFNGTLSANGRSYRATNSYGCKVVANKR